MRWNLAVTRRRFVNKYSSGFSSVTMRRAREGLISSISAASVVDLGDTQSTIVTVQPVSDTAHVFQITAASAATQSAIVSVAAGTQGVSGIIVVTDAAELECEDSRQMLSARFQRARLYRLG